MKTPINKIALSSSLPSGIRRNAFQTVLALSLFGTAVPGIAGTAVTVMADRAKVVKVAGEPTTVVVGNSMYADVSVQKGRIIIHGRHFGSTNIVVLDNSGNTLANLDLDVVRGGRRNVTIYKAGSRFSYNCAPNCESQIQVGDDPDYFDNVVTKQITQKTTLATASGKIDAE